jgi:hypothetical protein
MRPTAAMSVGLGLASVLDITGVATQAFDLRWWPHWATS